MRHTSRKTNVNAKQCSLLLLHQKHQHCRRLRGVSSTGTRALKQHALAVALSIVCAIFSSLSTAANTALDQTRTYQLNLPEQTVAAALNSLSEQTDIQVLFPYDIATQHQSTALVGNYPLQQALSILLLNTGLHAGLTDSGVITISRTGSNVDINQNGKGKNMNTNKRKTVLATMVGLFAAGGMSATMAQGQVGESARVQGVLDEIVVTASKRATSLQDTAMSITAISSEIIEKKGLVSMDDYLRTLPGVNMMEIGGGRKNPVVMRGISANPQVEDATVGTYFGEVPLSASSAAGVAAEWIGTPDIKLIDIDRVEVLRGPQGTLYGSGSLGGTVKVIPNEVELDKIEGSFSSGISETGGKGGDNYLVNGMINIPLVGETLAMRTVAYRYKNSGYIENIVESSTNDNILLAKDGGGRLVNQENVGEDMTDGVRVSLRWQPTEDFDSTLTYLYQDTEQLGLPEVELGLGKFEQGRVQVSPEVRDRLGGNGSKSETEIYSLLLSYDLGWGEIISSSSQMNLDASFSRDISFAGLGPADQGVSGDVGVFVEELRLSSTLEGSTQFIVGLYYEDVDWENNGINFWSGASELNTLASGTDFDPQFFQSDFVFDVKQKALFGELSHEMNELWKITLGARAFSYDKSQSSYDFSPIFEVDAGSSLESDESGETYKVNLTYTPTDDALLYLQWAEGFRLGRPLAPLPSSDLCDPDGDGSIITDDGRVVEHAESLDSDLLDSFELGGKFSFLENRMTVNASVYHINWEGLPVATTNVTTACDALQNAGEARSQGFELETAFQVTEQFLTEFGVSFVDAELTEDAGVVGQEGDRLPGSPKYNANISASYEFSLLEKPAYIRGDYAYVGGFYNNLQESGVEAGDYHTLNMKFGMAFDNVNMDIYINNMTDSDEVTWVNSVLSDDGRAYRLRPRTVGLNVSWHF